MRTAITHIVPTSASNPLLMSMLRTELADYSVIALSDDGPLGQELASIGVPMMTIDVNRSRPLEARRLVRTLRSMSPQVVECHALVPSVFGAAAASVMRARPRFVNVRHHNLNHHIMNSQRGRWADQFAIRQMDYSIAVSTAVRNTLIAEGARETRVSTVRNALLPEYLPELRLESTRAVDEGPLQLLAVGRLDWQKDYQTLLEALALVHHSGVNAYLTILGTGSQEQSRVLRETATRLRISDLVDFHGHVRVAAQWYRNADIFVHAARDEAFGLVFLEAMHAGLPIVATDVGAVREVLGVNYSLVPPQSPTAFANAILTMAADLKPHEEAARQLAGRVTTDFSAQTMAEGHLHVCYRVLSLSGLAGEARTGFPI